MANSYAIIGLSLLTMLCGRMAVGQKGGDPSPSSSSRYGCVDCCKRIDDQTAILRRISDVTEKMAVGIREIEEEIDDDIPAELEKQTENLEKQSSELKGMKASISEIATGFKNHSEDLLVHDKRLKELGMLLEKQNKLVKEIHDSLIGPRDCSDIKELGRNTSGLYRIYPGSLAKRMQADVYCDMTTPDGNWLVFQRRKDGSVNFERTWIEYMNGFGNPSGEVWLGNELLYLLTSNRKYKLRIDMEDFDGQKRYAEYSTFSISSSADKYRLTALGYKGNAGDSFSGHSGMQFSTKDADNDIYEKSCSLEFRGAWWYSRCHGSNLNGLYLRGTHKSYADGIEWHAFRGYHYSLKTTEMKIALAD